MAEQQHGDCCQWCHFWHPMNDTAWPRTAYIPDSVGECRRHAPIRTPRPDTYSLRVWPDTYGKDWCGDFERISK